jgi:3-phenylpropionate/trans-cinnamate dioxygenase ferredoxin reductase subunit
LVEALSGVQRVVVVGASFIGLEAASSLRKRGLEVEVVAPESAPLTSVFGERVGARLRAIHEQGGVRFHLGRSVKGISGGTRPDKVTLSSGEEIPCELVLVGIGVVPSVGYLPGTGLVEGGGIPVGPDLRTKIPDVWAAGDIAIVGGARIEHWVVALSHGQHAARAMLGREVRYAEVPFFWTKHFGQSLKYVGHAARSETILYRGDVEKDTFTAGYFGGDRLLAAAGIGRTPELVRIQEALRRGESIGAKEFESGAFGS